ncbi:MAG: hypothetical protein IAF38_17115 [Bacteroidia bacterium]|nr:hypothetical protein [Bacteroidia bacterium]
MYTEGKPIEKIADLKTRFYSNVKDFTVFDVNEELNILKVILDGLKVNYIKRWKIKVWINRPVFFIQVRLMIKKIIFLMRMGKKARHANNFLKNAGPRPVWLFDSARYAFAFNKEGKPISKIYNALIDHFGKSNLVFFMHMSSNKTYNYDLSLDNFLDGYRFSLLRKDEIKLRNELLACYKRICEKNIFPAEDIENILVAIDSFFFQFISWNRFLEKYKPKAVYLDCLYHKEAMVFGFRKHNVKVYELQHGLIAKEDVFYCFPEAVLAVRKRALFADKLFLYGQFWKNILQSGHEYSEDQLEIIGNYVTSGGVSEETEKELNKFINGKKVLLITTQTFVHVTFINYVKNILSSFADSARNWVVIVKIHPAETIGLFGELNAFKNVFVTKDFDIEHLFRNANAHLSVYSTTLFEALKYNIPNYSLYVEIFSDYIQSLLDNNISELITENENVFNLAEESIANRKTSDGHSSFFFEESQLSKLPIK